MAGRFERDLFTHVQWLYAKRLYYREPVSICSVLAERDVFLVDFEPSAVSCENNQLVSSSKSNWDSQCDLCLTEKTCIALHNNAPKKLLDLPVGCKPLNIRTEIMNGCKHKIEFKLLGGENQLTEIPNNRGASGITMCMCPGRSPVKAGF